MNPWKFIYCIQEVDDTVFIPKLMCHTVLSVEPDGSNLLSTWLNLKKQVVTKAATLKVLLPTGCREGASGKKDKMRGLFNRKKKFGSKKNSKSMDN